MNAQNFEEAMNGKLKSLANGIGAARHALALGLAIVAGVVYGTLIYAQVGATEEKAEANEQKIEAIRATLGGINTKQQVIINKIEGEKERSKDFRDDTRSALDRILQRLISADRDNR